MLSCFILLILVGAIFLFWREESELSCGLVAAIFTLCVVCLLIGTDTLPRDFFIRRGAWIFRRRGLGLSLEGLATLILIWAPFYLIVSHWVYPWRNRLMEAFDRRFGGRKR